MIRFNFATSAATAPLDFEGDGALRVVLAGDVVTMNPTREIVRGGYVCIEGNSIVAVLGHAEPIPPAFEKAPLIDTRGTIYPGLIDLHNHLTYNFIPLWNVSKKYENRDIWQGDAAYVPAVKGPFNVLAKNAAKDYSRAIVRFAECRNLFGGVTTGQGMALSGPGGYSTYFKGLIRNVEQPLEHDFPIVRCHTMNFKEGEIQTELIPWLKLGRPFIYHLSEGTDQSAKQRFLDLAAVEGAIAPGFIAIHCVALQESDFDGLINGSGIVWSPTSNLLLYGETCSITEAKKRNIPIAIGADWAPSGCKNLLGELKVAQAVSKHMGSILSTQELVEAVTITPAKMIQWDSFIGSVETGKRADLLIVEGTSSDPYGLLVQATESSIRAVLIDGRIRLSEAPWLAIGDQNDSEPVTIGGKQYVLDLTEELDNGMGGMTLRTATASLADGLKRLPELASEYGRQLMSIGFNGPPNDYRLVGDMDDDSDYIVELLRSGGSASDLAPMNLEPITAVDDPNFPSFMKASVNLPSYVKAIY